MTTFIGNKKHVYCFIYANYHMVFNVLFLLYYIDNVNSFCSFAAIRTYIVDVYRTHYRYRIVDVYCDNEHTLILNLPSTFRKASHLIPAISTLYFPVSSTFGVLIINVYTSLSVLILYLEPGNNSWNKKVWLCAILESKIYITRNCQLA